MKISGSVKEDLIREKRISITPETTKKFTELKFPVFLERNYAEHIGINDKEYEKHGASFYNSAKEVLEKSQIILKVGIPAKDEIDFIKKETILVGQFDLYSDKQIINSLIKKILIFFHLIYYHELPEPNQWTLYLPKQI